MQRSATPSTSSTPIRLLIAFVLGVLAGLVFLFDLPYAPFQWWTFVIPAAVILIAMLLSILFNPVVRKGTIAPLRLIIISLSFLLVDSALVVALVLLSAIDPAFNSIMVVLLPFALGLAAAFTIGSSGRLGLDVVGALVAWLGSGISLIINAVLFYIAYEKTTPGGDGEIALPLTIVGVVILFGVAALGGLVGRLLRNRLLRTPPTSSKEN